MALAPDPAHAEPVTTTTDSPLVSTPTRTRVGWVIAVTLAALAVLIVLVLYAIDVL